MEAGLLPIVVETNCAPVSGDSGISGYDCTCDAGEVAVSGSTISEYGNVINAWQAGPSYGGAAATWRVSCAPPSCNEQDLGVVCLGSASASALHVETNCTQLSGSATDCTCNAGEVAISGGANSGTGTGLSAMQAGPSYGGSAATWRVSCTDGADGGVACSEPFALCLGAPYAALVHVEQNCTPANLFVGHFVVGSAFDCACNAGEVAISGGADGTHIALGIDGNTKSPQFWRVSCGDALCSHPFAVCAAQ